MTDVGRDTWVRSITFAAELVAVWHVAPTAIHRRGFHPTGVLGALALRSRLGLP